MKRNTLRIIIISLLLTVPVTAQPPVDVSVCIDPGHGGHESDDRYMPATGFWESESNFEKALYLKQMLENIGVTVILTRTGNDDDVLDDPSLSQRAAIANENNVDYFHSIHSNGTASDVPANVNFPLMLFRGYTTAPVYPQAKEMGEIMWYKLNTPNNQWTYYAGSTPFNAGDWTFYPDWGTQGLGVLRPLTRPGTLSEGQFHDYVPNSWRLISSDYRKHEAILLLRAFTEFFSLASSQYGVLAGIVRDQTENVLYAYDYNANLPNDKLKTIDNAKVTLLPLNRVYIVDNNKNGFYMFDSLPPGEYDVVFDAGIYDPDTVFNVSVDSNQTSFANAFLAKDPTKPPEVYQVSPEEGTVEVNTYAQISVTFSRPMNTVTTQNAFSISPPAAGTLHWQSNNQVLVFVVEDTLQTAQLYTITVSTQAESSPGVPLAEEFVSTFTTRATHINPRVISYFPPADLDSAIIYSDITVRFDMSMEKQITESAFAITPQVPGIFTWNNDSTELMFTPDDALQRGQEYSISIFSTAKNSRGVTLGSDFDFNFITRLRNEINIIKSFPRPGEVNIYPFLNFYFKFDANLDLSTIQRDQFVIRDQSGAIILPGPITTGRDYLTFLPRRQLDYDTQYTITISSLAFADTIGLRIEDSLVVTFVTESEAFGDGLVIDDFEQIGSWMSPGQSPATTGLDTLTSDFNLATSPRMNGSYSGELTYSFNGSEGGLCQVKNSAGFDISSDPSSLFGVWVYSDFSFNMLEFWFEHSVNSNQVVIVDTLDWSGWKLKIIPVSEILATGPVKFHSLVIKQRAEGERQGTVYFDDAQYNLTSDLGETYSEQILPAKYALKQNYPNPFNPQTTIHFQTPVKNRVRITVYNILGQQVTSLLDDVKEAGSYRIQWKPTNLPTGIYFYSLEAGSFKQIRKLLFIK